MQIFIHTISGKTITVDVELSDVVEDLKLKYLEREGICPLNVRFVYCGRQLEDSQTLEQCHVKKASTIFANGHYGSRHCYGCEMCLPSDKIVVYFTTPFGSDQDSIALQIPRDASLEDLQRRAEEEFGRNLALIYNDEVLPYDSSQNIATKGIAHGTTLVVVVLIGKHIHNVDKDRLLRQVKILKLAN